MALFGAKMMGIVLVALYCCLSIRLALAQSEAYSRVSEQQQVASEEPRLRAINFEPRPLNSDALYICTISGCGRIARCHARR
jgi:hypothetical protein